MRGLLPLLLLWASSIAAIEVVDDTGRTVTLAAPPARIIALAPHLTEMLFAIGAGEQLVGVVSFSDYPAAAKAIPQIGSYDRVDMEAIVALKPDLIVGWQSGNSPTAMVRLEALGFPLYLSEPRRLASIPGSLERLGRLTGNAGAGETAALRFRQRFALLKERYRRVAPISVFYQVWDAPLMTVNRDHIIDELLTLCGGTNVFAKLDTLVPQISREAVVVADPEVIVTGGMGRPDSRWLEAWRRWGTMRAVRHDNLFLVNPDWTQRAGPRLLDGAEQICGVLAEARRRRE